MYKKAVTIHNKSGLHARPASLFVEHAKSFSSEVFVAKPDGIQVNAKSILGILSLGVNKGSIIEISAQGPDAKEAIDELVNFIENFNPDS